MGHLAHMNQGKYVFAQLMCLVDANEFRRCVTRYKGDFRVRQFTCWHQFLCMSFGQLTNRSSLRDVVTCLQAHDSKLYHLGLSGGVSRTTLAEANEQRDWRIYSDLAQGLIQQARQLYAGTQLEGLEFYNTVYALDSTTIDLCLEVFWWAKFRKHKAAIKLHTLFDVRCQVPCFVHVTDGLSHDVNILDVLEYERDAFYIMDRAYLDWSRLCRIHDAGAFFVMRAKRNVAFVRIYSRDVDKTTGLRCDQTVRLDIYNSAINFPEYLRRVKYYDKEHDRTLVFLTNNFDIDAYQVALLYKYRWQIELFFKWVKQHLKIQVFWGESSNAVKTQIWVAVCTYVLVAILKKQLNLTRSLNEILQILSVSAFDKTPVNQLLAMTANENNETPNDNQLILFDL
jgi:hypothetical protein